MILKETGYSSDSKQDYISSASSKMPSLATNEKPTQAQFKVTPRGKERNNIERRMRREKWKMKKYHV